LRYQAVETGPHKDSIRDFPVEDQKYDWEIIDVD
jgi:hypothetical protein